MAITNTDRSVTHTGNGATTAFEYTFQIPDAGSLFVQLLEISTGTLTDVAAIDYTATGLGSESGGFVNYPLSGSPLASTHKIVIYRQVPATQTTIITNQVRYYADVAMRVWDRIVMMVQDLRNDADRSLRAPVGETLDDLPTASSRAGKYLFFNATTGGVEAAQSIVGLTGITASATEINVLDGLLASTAELNILDGATLTVTELNYVDGVTSAIQTQLDAKQPLDADLTALAGLASAGMIARTGSGTVAARTLTAGTGISIINGDGVAGNPTITAGAAGWEAYNTTGDGKFYDFAVHGAVASVETPTFADGYEYMIIAESFGKGVSGAALTFQVELYRNQAAAYAGAAAFFLTTGTAALSVTGFVALCLPRRTVRTHYIIGHMSTDTTDTTTSGGLNYDRVHHTTATKIDKARVSWSTAALSTSGKLYLYRRILA